MASWEERESLVGVVSKADASQTSSRAGRWPWLDLAHVAESSSLDPGTFVRPRMMTFAVAQTMCGFQLEQGCIVLAFTNECD
jgi:hypothetical protein